MSYLDLFQRYGSPSREAEIRLHGYLIRPDTLTADRIQYNDETAEPLLRSCNRLEPINPAITTKIFRRILP